MPPSHEDAFAALRAAPMPDLAPVRAAKAGFRAWPIEPTADDPLVEARD